jgi:4-hydroxyphenylpyruvate dioxygenase
VRSSNVRDARAGATNACGNAMRRSIATVSMSGTLRDKLEAIAAARFHGYEIFEPDLLYYNASPADVGRMAADLGLACELYQPFRDFEGMPRDVFERSLPRAERKFDVMQALGCQLLLVCSNTRADVIGDVDLMAEQLRALAERGARRGLRIGYEALAWGRVVNRYADAWRVVERADHPHLGLILDSFHTLSLRDDPSGIARIPGEKIFFLQMADAPAMRLDVIDWARHHRNFPGQGDLDVVGFFEQVLLAGYRGPLSLEIFNDVFRETPNRRTALDAMRSLLFLEGEARTRLREQARRDAQGRAAQVLDRIELFDPPAPARFSGVAFIEFGVDDDAQAESLDGWFTSLGFIRAARHRTKKVTLYRQGEINLILNADPDSPIRGVSPHAGPAIFAIALWTDDPIRAQNRATSLLSARFDGRRGAGEADLRGIVAPDRTIIYFIPQDLAPDRLFEIDFEFDSDAREPTTPRTLRRVDHVALGLSRAKLDSWVLFCRAVLGMSVGASLELADPFGLVRSTGLATDDRTVRFVLNVSYGEATQTARTVSAGGGVTVHHVALLVDDIVTAIDALRERGVATVPISRNYYDDLEARLDLDPARVAALRERSILYDRSDTGEYLHAYTSSFAGRFFFEIVQRLGDYDQYGAMNAPARLVSQAQSHPRSAAD